MPKIHGTSTVWSCRLYRCNWTLSRDFDPVHKRKLSLSSDRRSALLSHLQPPANRLPIRAAPRVPAASSSSTRISYWKKKIIDWILNFFFFCGDRKKIYRRERFTRKFTTRVKLKKISKWQFQRNFYFRLP